MLGEEKAACCWVGPQVRTPLKLAKRWAFLKPPMEMPHSILAEQAEAATWLTRKTPSGGSCRWGTSLRSQFPTPFWNETAASCVTVR